MKPKRKKLEIWIGESENFKCIDITVWSKDRKLYSNTRILFEELQEYISKNKLVEHCAYYGVNGESGAGFTLTWRDLQETEILASIPYEILDKFIDLCPNLGIVIGSLYSDKEILNNTDEISEIALSVMWDNTKPWHYSGYVKGGIILNIGGCYE